MPPLRAFHPSLANQQSGEWSPPSGVSPSADPSAIAFWIGDIPSSSARFDMAPIPVERFPLLG